jgi:hypothetical protein
MAAAMTTVATVAMTMMETLEMTTLSGCI